MPDRSRNMNNNISKKSNEDSRVVSCIQSPNMLDDDGLNGCPPKCYRTIVESEAGRQQTRGGKGLNSVKKTSHNASHSGMKIKYVI